MASQAIPEGVAGSLFLIIMADYSKYRDYGEYLEECYEEWVNRQETESSISIT